MDVTFSESGEGKILNVTENSAVSSPSAMFKVSLEPSEMSSNIKILRVNAEDFTSFSPCFKIHCTSFPSSQMSGS